MRRQRCPYCQGVVDILDSDLGRMVQCDKVRCAGWFLAMSEQPAETAAPTPLPASPPPTTPFLTGPHRCHVCGGETNRVLNLRRCTVIHRPPGADRKDNCRMVVYAAIYLCPQCDGPTLLETPYHQWGQDVTCPVCRSRFQAPRDDVLHEKAGDAREGVTMAFRCPGCDLTLRCDTRRAGEPITGTRVVCSGCRHVLIVPAHGEAVARFSVSRRGKSV